MAITGSKSLSTANGMCEWLIDWTVEASGEGLVYTFNIYFDVGTAQRVTWNSGVTAVISIGGKRYTVNNDDMSSTGKTLIGTITTDTLTLEEIQENDQTNDVTLSFSYFRAYTGLITYVKVERNHYIQCGDFSECLTAHASSLSVVNTILGADTSITVSKGNDEFTHTITYDCGTASGTICTKSTDTALTAVLPVSLAAQNTTGTRVKVVFEITTHYGNVTVASKSVTAYYSIPDSVKPACTIQVTEGAYMNGQPISDIYGGYVQKQSMLHIVVTPVSAYGSPIASYSVVANGGEFNTAETTTGVLKNSGTQQIAVTVTDQRGRTSEIVAETIDVIPYSVPVVTKVKITRCDENGVEQASGNDHIKVTFDAEISPVNDINTASYMLTYQKTSGLQQTDIILTEYNGIYSVADGSYIFEAATDSAYDVTISAIDDFGKGSRTTGGSTATTIFNIIASGLGMCFGGVATLENVIENMFLTYPSGGFMFPKLESGESLYGINTPNVYTCESGYDITGSPTGNPFVLILLPCGVNELVFIIIDTELNVYIRTLVDSSYSVWKTFTLTDVE